MVHDSTAARRSTWRKAATLLLACTALCAPHGAAAQSLPTPQSTNSNSPNRAALPVTGTATQSGTTTIANETDTGEVQADDTTLTTAAPPPASNPGDAVIEPLDDAAAPYDEQQNLYEPTVDGGENTALTGPEQTPGIRLGTFLLRPAISETVNTETEKSPGDKRTRSYFTTGIRGTLTSDWARHSLTVIGDSAFQRNFGSSSEGEEPTASLDADLQLDLGADTTAHLTAGYNFSREDTEDPNALTGVAEQGGEHEFTGGASIERDFGALRGLAALELNRTIYTDAKARDGTSISLAERDRTGGDLRGRAGYELSPALIPFIELSVGQTAYDQKRDTTGYERSSKSFGAKFGTEFDLGEKLRGELAVGYIRKDYDDARLASIDGVSWDGNLTWSPQRGTDVNLGLRTIIEDFSSGPSGGWISNELTTGLTHQLRNNLVARLTSRIIHRTFPSSDTNDVTEYNTGAGLTWGINRYLDLTGDINYQRTPAYDSSTLSVGAGLTLKR